MQHNLIDRLRRIGRVPLTPIVANRVCENGAIPIESRCADRSSHLRVSLETMLGVFIPEMERPVAAGGAEGAVDRVEGDGVDGEDVGDVARIGGGDAVAFEGEVGAGEVSPVGGVKVKKKTKRSFGVGV